MLPTYYYHPSNHACDTPLPARPQAIHDGVIDATINHEEGFVASKEVIDVYATGEPQEAFHKRIAFCLKMHNDSVMGLRFPPNAFRKYLQTTEVG